MTPALVGDSITDGDDSGEMLRIELMAFAAEPP